MKHLVLALGLFSLVSQGTLFAHSNHVHAPAIVIKAENAKELASATVSQLATDGKIEKSWKDVKANEPTEKKFGGGSEWVVTFDNPKAEDKEKQKLYVFVSTDGRVLASNFTGK